MHRLLELSRFGLALLTLLPVRVSAHHVVDFVVTSTEPLGGQLRVSYDFTTAVPLTYNFTLGDAAVFTGTTPGFDTADGDEYFPGTNIPYPIFPPGVPIRVVLVDNDAGRTAMKVSGVMLAQPGDSALLGVSAAQPPGDLHRHPEWQLRVRGDAGTFGEGRIAFKIVSPDPAYRDSPVYSLTLTNGHLPAPEYAADALDRSSLRCQTTVSRIVQAYAGQVLTVLRRCLEALQVYRAHEVAGLDAARALTAAERTCARTVDALAKAQAKAQAGIRKRCGAAGSDDYDDALIGQHLGLVRCRMEGAIAAAHFRARTDLGKLRAAGRPLRDHVPCVVRTAGEEEGAS